jgi:hypothetical protein
MVTKVSLWNGKVLQTLTFMNLLLISPRSRRGRLKSGSSAYVLYAVALNSNFQNFVLKNTSCLSCLVIGECCVTAADYNSSLLLLINNNNNNTIHIRYLFNERIVKKLRTLIFWNYIFNAVRIYIAHKMHVCLHADSTVE